MKDIIERLKKYYCENKLKNKTFKSNIPNILTASRLFSPLVIIPLVATGNIFMAIIATATFASTDFADGKLARKWNAFSKLGEVLDAIADKVFASAILIASSILNPLLIINMIPEVLIAVTNAKAFKKNLEVKSSFLGKVKTWSLFLTIIISLIPSLTVSLVSDFKIILDIITKAMIVTTYSLQTFTFKDYYEKNVRNSKEQANQGRMQSAKIDISTEKNQ